MFAPHPPSQVYRGDRYRLNITAGTILSLAVSAPEGAPSMDLEDVSRVLEGQNLLAGIPGGPAGSQWSPPPVVPERTHEGVPDTAPAAEPERYPDTLREYCTYFDSNLDRVTGIVRMLDYCGLLTYDQDTGLVQATDLGKKVHELLQQAETQARNIAAGQKRLSPVQEYLARDSRDVFLDPHTVPFPVYSFSITDAVRVAQDLYRKTPPNADGKPLEPSAVFSAAPPLIYAQAAENGANAPETVVEYNYGDPEFDAALPIRRHMFRKPSYRQFLWIALNDRHTFVLGMSGLSPRNIEIVGNASRAAESPRDRTDPEVRKVKTNRSLARKIKDFAHMVLSGGPESVWAGKPLNPRDVHSDTVSFHAAGRPGFNEDLVRGSSIAWEAYERSNVTMRDFETARETLINGHKAGLLKNVAAAPATVDSAEVALRAVTENEDHPFMRIDEAGAFVERTSNEMMREIGIDIEVAPEVSPTGVPFDIRCTFTEEHKNNATGLSKITKCRAKAIGGSGYCERHGGSYLSPEETASLVRATQQKLFAASSKAVEVMAELMVHSTNDAVRLRAAEQVLNRSGLGESRDVNVHLKATVDTEGRSPAEAVRERLAQLTRVPAPEQQEIERRQRSGDISQYGEPIVEAEVVEDD